MNTILSFNINIGDLTEVKKDRLKDIFIETLPTVVSMSNQLILNGEDEQLIITPLQIQYSFKHEYFERVQENLIKVQELLMLDTTINNIIIILANLKNIKKNSLNYTKELFKSLVSDCIGVGKREFFNYEDKLSEIKIEPYISENTNIYIEARYNVGEKNLNDISNVLKSIKSNYNSKEEEIVSNLK